MSIHVCKSNGTLQVLDTSKISTALYSASGEKYKHLVPELELASKLHFFDGIETSYIRDILIKTARDLSGLRSMGMEKIAANLMVQRLYSQVCGGDEPKHLKDIIEDNIELGYYTPILRTEYTDKEIDSLHSYIDYSRDSQFTSSGIEAFLDKYIIHHNGIPIELPQHAFMAIAMDAFHDYPNRMKWIKKAYKGLSTFKITLPTPEMKALRTPLSDYASCTLLKTGDSLDSWNEASKALVLHTAASAGVGNDISSISSIGDLVRNDSIVHGGKVPVLKSVDADIQKAVQNGRRGSATAFICFYDPEIVRIMSLKSPRTEVAKRINDLSYGIKVRELVYERARNKQPISLFSHREVPELYEVFHSGTAEEFKALYEQLESDMRYTEQIDARYFFDMFNTEAFENSAYYLMNVDEVNMNSPYTETIYQSNICMEEVSPTKDISESRPDDPDIAICVLANINQGLVSVDELEEYTELLVRLQTHIMVKQNHPMPQANAYVRQYQSIGIGMSNHAYWLASQGLRYGSKRAMVLHDEWMEHFQFGLIKASMELAREIGPAPVFFERSTYAQGIMPLDRYNKNVDELVPPVERCDWNWLRSQVIKIGMANVALSMIPPAESSSVPSSQTNGLEPIKNLITFKETKGGVNAQFAPNPLQLADKYDFAYDTKDMTERYLRHVAISQKWVDKSISANRFYNPELYKNSLVPLSVMHADLFYAKYFGIKTFYYTNTFVADVEDTKQGCAGDGCSV